MELWFKGACLHWEIEKAYCEDRAVSWNYIVACDFWRGVEHGIPSIFG